LVSSLILLYSCNKSAESQPIINQPSPVNPPTVENKDTASKLNKDLIYGIWHKIYGNDWSRRIFGKDSFYQHDMGPGSTGSSFIDTAKWYWGKGDTLYILFGSTPAKIRVTRLTTDSMTWVVNPQIPILNYYK
jgi:hypothetical protein